jgi:hypothetical protein
MNTHHKYLKAVLLALAAVVLVPGMVYCQVFVKRVSDTIRAPFEVHGVAGAGTTSALFGGEHGISFQRSYPAIGFNVYRDDQTVGNRGKYMKTGYAAVMSLATSNQLNPGGFALSIFPSGATGTVLGQGIANLVLAGYEFRLNTNITSGTSLNIGRGTGFDGTAAFSGTAYSSHFNFSTAEHTYIRGGRAGSRVYINDLYKGTTIIGNGASRVGLNDPDPVCPLEIRQVNGLGVKFFIARQQITYNWEWRVGGSPNNLVFYYGGTPKASFSSADGAYTSISDARLKKNVRELPSVLDKILQLNPVTYEMIADNPGHFRSTGFLAQEVETLFPGLVQSRGNDSTRILQYSGFQTLAIKGIQEEQKELAAIDKQAQALEAKLAELEEVLLNKPLIPKAKK